jgi:hypothetical protein
MKMEVEICDSCKSMVAKHQCFICKNMLCSSCASGIYIGKSEPLAIRTTQISSINKDERKYISSICDKCRVELRDMIGKFEQMKIEKQALVDKEIILFIKEKMESVLLADKI